MTFTAKYAGTCFWCGYEFDQGEEIGYIEDSIACNDCMDEDDRQRQLYRGRPWKI